MRQSANMLKKIAPLKRCLPLVMLGMAATLPVYAQSAASENEADMDQAAEQMRQVMLQQPGVNENSDGVTLPLYPDATVMIHYTDPSVIPSLNGDNLGEGALPTIMFETSDGIEDVAAFYADQLEGFERVEPDADVANGVTFGKDMPEGLDPLNMEEWMNTVPYHEHVSIYSAGENTAIEMAYEPE